MKSRSITSMIIAITLALLVAISTAFGAPELTLNLENYSSNSPASITIETFQRFVMQLTSNTGSTGYSWTVINADQDSIEIGVDFISSTTVTPNGAEPGTPSTLELTYEGLAPGQYTLDLVYARSWELVKILNPNGSINYAEATALGINFSEIFVQVNVVFATPATQLTLNLESASSNSPHSLTIKVGEKLQIDLTSNTGSTGYSWTQINAAEDNQAVVAYVKSVTVNENGGAIGAPQVLELTYKGVAPGEYTLDLVYARPSDLSQIVSNGVLNTAEAATLGINYTQVFVKVTVVYDRFL